MIPVNVFIFSLITLIAFARIFTYDTSGDYNFELRPILLFLVWVIFFVIWGGVFWW